MSDLIYGLNGEDRIIMTGGNWDDRALQTGSSAVTRFVLYKPIWDFITGAEVRGHLDDILRACRASGERYQTLMRCDEPETGVLTRMTVEHLGHGILIVEHKTLQAGRLPRSPVVALADRYSDGRCSHCCALRFGEDWTPSFWQPSARQFPTSYVICPECRANRAPRRHAFLLQGMQKGQRSLP